MKRGKRRGEKMKGWGREGELSKGEDEGKGKQRSERDEEGRVKRGKKGEDGVRGELRREHEQERRSKRRAVEVRGRKRKERMDGGGGSPLGVWTEACEGPRSRRSAAKHSKQAQVTVELDAVRQRDDLHWLMMMAMRMMDPSEKSQPQPEHLDFLKV